jgi:hypothetical protein
VSAGKREIRRQENDQQRRAAMAEPNQPASYDEVYEEPVPVMQQIMDNPWILLFLGVVIPTVLYLIWGVMEIISIPVAP